MSDFNFFKFEMGFPEHLFQNMYIRVQHILNNIVKFHRADSINIIAVFDELDFYEKRLFINLLRNKNREVIIEPIDGPTFLHVGVQIVSDEVFEIRREPWLKHSGFSVQHVVIRKLYYAQAKKKKKNIFEIWNRVCLENGING